MHVYVDESKARGYVVAAATVLPADLVSTRKLVRELILPGQTRLHMKAELPPRKKLVLSKLAALGPITTVYTADRATYGTDISCRRACLEVLVTDIASSCEFLILESDASQDARDRRDLIALTRQAGCRETLSYDHMPATSEPLLAIPDAVAWAWARGGDWTRLVRPLIKTVKNV